MNVILEKVKKWDESPCILFGKNHSYDFENCYVYEEKTIYMQNPECFNSEKSFNLTLFHELGHYSDHIMNSHELYGTSDPYLNITNLGDEIVAETVAGSLMKVLRLGDSPRTFNYINHCLCNFALGRNYSHKSGKDLLKKQCCLNLTREIWSSVKYRVVKALQFITDGLGCDIDWELPLLYKN